MSNIGDTIRNLRERMGVRQEKLAEWVGVSRGTIAQVEHGKRDLESLELFRIADFFGCTVSDLLNRKVEEFDPASVRFRRSIGVQDDTIWEAVVRSIKLAREAGNLRDILGIGVAEAYVPSYRIAAPADKVEAIRQGYQTAQKERNRLGLGFDRIVNIGELMESQGVYAGELEMPDDVSGFTISLGDPGSICMVNEKHPGLRKRFSLAHEYGHVLMDSDLGAIVSRTAESRELIEVRANVFAAGFLMPESGCYEMIRKIGKGSASRESAEVFDGQDVTRIEERYSAEEQQIQLYDATRLAFYFGVSIQAMLYRLKNLRLISQARLEALLEEEGTEAGEHLKRLMHQNDTDGRLNEPDFFRCTVINMALEALRRGSISRGKCMELGRQACRDDQFEDFRSFVEDVSREDVPVMIPGEDSE
jgi:Zn-dependent peptidase ImmA (M78 family)/DNA-binding XRE family transcriptional regulator